MGGYSGGGEKKKTTRRKVSNCWRNDREKKSKTIERLCREGEESKWRID